MGRGCGPPGEDSEHVRLIAVGVEHIGSERFENAPRSPDLMKISAPPCIDCDGPGEISVDLGESRGRGRVAFEKECEVGPLASPGLREGQRTDDALQSTIRRGRQEVENGGLTRSRHLP